MRKIALGNVLVLAAALAATDAPRPARADEKPNVVATLPHLAAHARAIGGDRIAVQTLGAADKDPHFITPTPALMVKANAAQLYLEVGLFLELWSEPVLDGARNASIRVGAPGHVYVSAGVAPIEVPATVSRAQGDVHPSGNPHIWLDPLNAIVEARNVAEGLKRIDAAGAADYDARLRDYAAKIEKAYFGEELVRLLGSDTLAGLARKGNLHAFLETKKYKGAPLADKVGGWMKTLWPHRGAKIFTYHREWSYFARAFNFEVVNTLEPKPGIPPSPGHLAELERTAKAQKMSGVLTAPYYNVSLAREFGSRTGIPVLVTSTEPDDTEAKADYVAFMDKLVDEVAKTLAPGGTK